MFKQQNKMTVMDFTGIYENENFYKHKNIEWLDFRGLQGVYGYCSQQARKSIEDKIKSLSPEGIHFIDSGNFHYVSEFWLEKIKQDFIKRVIINRIEMHWKRYISVRFLPVKKRSVQYIEQHIIMEKGDLQPSAKTVEKPYKICYYKNEFFRYRGEAK